MGKTRITILSCEVLDDLRSASWLISEITDLENLHARHEMADICEKDNIEAVWRTLGVAASEVRLELMKILEPQKDMTLINNLRNPPFWEFSFRVRLTDSKETYLRDKIHEYLVARVMADRSAAIIPEASSYWKDRSSEALAGIRLAAADTPDSQKARRPLWPFLP